MHFGVSFLLVFKYLKSDFPIKSYKKIETVIFETTLLVISKIKLGIFKRKTVISRYKWLFLS